LHRNRRHLRAVATGRLYSSHLFTWRRLAERGKREALSPKKRGPKPKVTDERDKRIELLERENAKLAHRAERAEALVEIQKNFPRARSYLLNQKLPNGYSMRGSEGAAGCFLETTAIP